MKKITLFMPVLILCLCLLFVSSVYPAKPQPPPTYVSYYGYAMLYDNISPNNPYMIASDGQGQYMDRALAKGSPSSKRGDRIQVWLTYNSSTGKYDLTSFVCFLGKPELNWRSARRVNLNFDFAIKGTKVAETPNQTLTDLLLYNVTGFNANKIRRGNQVGTEYHLTDGSVHIAFIKGTVGQEEPNEVSTIILIDKTDTADDSEAITQTNFEKAFVGSTIPRYWTSLEGASSSGGVEIDTHDHIGLFIFKYQLNFTPIEFNGITPITWEVTPMPGLVNMYVRRVTGTDPAYDYSEESLWTFSGLPFRLIVSKHPLTAGAPPKQLGTAIDTWVKLRSK